MNLIVTIALCLVTIAPMIAAHYETLILLTRATARQRSSKRRHAFLAIAALLALHVAEVALFAASFYVAVEFLNLGTFINPRTMTPLDYFYYAAETYSSLGYGDIYPLGAIRLLAAVTPLAGLMFLGWSSAFLFALVQHAPPLGPETHEK